MSQPNNITTIDSTIEKILKKGEDFTEKINANMLQFNQVNEEFYKKLSARLEKLKQIAEKLRTLKITNIDNLTETQRKLDEVTEELNQTKKPVDKSGWMVNCLRKFLDSN